MRGNPQARALGVGGEGRTDGRQRITGWNGVFALLVAVGLDSVHHMESDICRKMIRRWVSPAALFSPMQARAEGSADGRDGGIIPATGGRADGRDGGTHSESIAFQCLAVM
jgi:hypothetical protein